MKRTLSERQRKYHKYLTSPEWEVLRGGALRRDGMCVECGSLRRLAAHHIRYPERLEDTVVEDLKTLCRTCHRIEHGLFTKLPYDWAFGGIYSKMNHEEAITERELVVLFWLGAQDGFDLRDARSIICLWRRAFFNETLAQAQELAARLELESRSYAGPEAELGMGDLCELLRKTYYREKIKL